MTSSPMITSVTPPTWLLVIQGIAGILFGLLLVLAPGASSVVLVQFLGIYWLVGGVVGLVSLIWDRSLMVWKILGGVLGLVAGIAIIQHPLWSPILVGTTLVVFFGAIALGFGVTELVRGFGGAGWGAVALGVVDILVGLLLIVDPLAGAIALPLLIGILVLVGGIATPTLAFRTDGTGAGGPDPVVPSA